MFDNIENTTKSVNASMKDFPTIVRFSIVGIVFVGLIVSFIVFEFIVGMIKGSSQSNLDHKIQDNNWNDPNSIKADTDPSHPWYTHNQGFYDD